MGDFLSGVQVMVKFLRFSSPFSRGSFCAFASIAALVTICANGIGSDERPHCRE